MLDIELSTVSHACHCCSPSSLISITFSTSTKAPNPVRIKVHMIPGSSLLLWHSTELSLLLFEMPLAVVSPSVQTDMPSAPHQILQVDTGHYVTPLLTSRTSHMNKLSNLFKNLFPSCTSNKLSDDEAEPVMYRNFDADSNRSDHLNRATGVNMDKGNGGARGSPGNGRQRENASYQRASRSYIDTTGNHHSGYNCTPKPPINYPSRHSGSSVNHLSTWNQSAYDERKQIAHASGKSSVSQDYNTFTEQQSEQFSAHLAASKEGEKKTVEADQELKVLEDNVVTKEQEQELRSVPLPDSVKGVDDFSLERNMYSQRGIVPKSASFPELYSQATRQYSAIQEDSSAGKKKRHGSLPYSANAKEEMLGEWPGLPSTGGEGFERRATSFSDENATRAPRSTQTTAFQTGPTPTRRKVPQDNRTFKQGNRPPPLLPSGSFKRKSERNIHQEDTQHKKFQKLSETSREDTQHKFQKLTETRQEDTKFQKFSGLTNLGNTCYMNCVLQCLYHTTELTDFLLSKNVHINFNTKTKGDVTRAFTKLLTHMKNNTNTEPALRELKWVAGEHDPEFFGPWQREAHDFLSVMLTWLTKELGEEDTEELEIKQISIPNLRPSFLVDLFNGIHCSTFICEKKNKVFLTKYEPFSNLTLAVNNMSSSIEDVFKGHYKSQMIMWNCKLCNEDHECRHVTRIYRLPRVLIVHLSRYNRSAIGTSRKAEVFPSLVLNLDAHLHHDVKRGQTYELYAFCTHLGKMSGGHYIAHHMDRPGSWTLFDDSFVQHDVSPNIDKAHILFYRAKRRDLVIPLSEVGQRSLVLP
ncbi:ubiquitin carboxyl-terminal hydrolase 4-like [Penaeus chinensis]|uniref:ubiquitin carboxyl-terminal hydrolase 4-like n=1 Tax=Penaeus chinensis TaxID=139456 RepID=UPI001FB83D46|nr:ubiquitin carboxyl-terminal hydrolase 4-like [Penaeus chinensis]